MLKWEVCHGFTMFHVFPDTSLKLWISVDFLCPHTSLLFKKKVSDIPHTCNLPADWAANSQLALVFMASLTVWGFSHGTCSVLDAASTPPLKTSVLLTAAPLACCLGLFFCFVLPHLQPSLTLSFWSSVNNNSKLPPGCNPTAPFEGNWEQQV